MSAHTPGAAASLPGRHRGSLARKVGTLLLLPSVIVLLAWMIVPLVLTLWFSFQYYNLVDPTTTRFRRPRQLSVPGDRSGFLGVAARTRWCWSRRVLVVTVGLGTLLAVAVQPAVPWTQRRPRAGDLAVLRHAHGQRADLEEPADAPDLRGVRRHGTQRRAAAGRLVRASSRSPPSSPSSRGNGCPSRC